MAVKKDLGKLFSCYPSKSLTFFIAAARRINAAMIGKSFPSHFCIEYDAFVTDARNVTINGGVMVMEIYA